MQHHHLLQTLFDFTMEKKLTIKELAPDDRPREKAINNGIQSLSNAELIAILLSTGTANKSAVDVARDLLDANNNILYSLLQLTIQDLQKIEGIGPAKAVTIAAALEIGKRIRKTEALEKKDLSTPQKVYEHMLYRLQSANYESFWVLYMNTANVIVGEMEIGKGGLDSVSVDIRKLFGEVLRKGCNRILLCHNHPSGTLKPSSADKQLTEKVKAAAALLDISLLDHVIISDFGYFSFMEGGLL